MVNVSRVARVVPAPRAGLSLTCRRACPNTAEPARALGHPGGTSPRAGTGQGTPRPPRQELLLLVASVGLIVLGGCRVHMTASPKLQGMRVWLPAEGHGHVLIR